jgi:hypothetical protein
LGGGCQGWGEVSVPGDAHVFEPEPGGHLAQLGCELARYGVEIDARLGECSLDQQGPVGPV